MEKINYIVQESRRHTDGKTITINHVFTDKDEAIEFSKEISGRRDLVTVHVRGWQIDDDNFNDFFTDKDEARAYCERYGLKRDPVFRSLLQPATKVYKLFGWPNTGYFMDINTTSYNDFYNRTINH